MGALGLMGQRYRRWLVAYATHIGCEQIQSGRPCTLASIRDEMDDLGLLDAVERHGDTWLLDVVRGPFEKLPDGSLAMEKGVEADDFPAPKMPPPPTFDPPPVEEEPAEPAPKKGKRA